MTTRIGSQISANVQKRVLKNARTAELYLTAVPAPLEDLEAQARDLYAAILHELDVSGGHILSERIFATADAMRTVEAVRNAVLHEKDDGVAPTRVVVSCSPIGGSFAGAQVHAICGARRPFTLRCWGQSGGTAARMYSQNGDRWVFINGMSGTTEVDPARQAQRMFCCAGCLLDQAGASMRAVPRTWLWLKDVCSWYDDFNSARTSFFKKSGLIDTDDHTTRLPASTGIGLHVPDGSACTLDLIAIPGREDDIELVEAGGDQESAFQYGSAFSRASVAPMPGGKTVFVSGTAAVDRKGDTEHVDRADAQIDATLSHVQSLLADLDCDDRHVLTALVYCKSASVEEAFRRRHPHLIWPRLTMIGDVCRPELLFEVEVTASPELGSRSVDTAL